MRALASFVAIIALTACGTAPGSPGPGEPSSGHTLTLPAEHTSAREIIVYADREGDGATEETELDYALGDDYPARVTLSPKEGYVLGKGCKTQLGAVLWKSVTKVEGTAAKLSLDQGVLALDLQEEGEVSAILEGEMVNQHCTSAGGVVVTTVPLTHRMVLRIHRIGGFAVEMFHQTLASCWDAVVLPAGAPLWAPKASPIDRMGQRFEAENAPAPVAITLESEGALTLDATGRLSAEPGTASVSLDTTLPVEGLRSFVVVASDALTDVQATLYLRKAAAKGSISEIIEEGETYSIFFPDMSNGVELHVDAAMTDRGRLCDNVPASWFATTSATPDQCLAGAGADDEWSSFVSVASIRAPGECRLEVTIPRTSQTWATRFSITF